MFAEFELKPIAWPKRGEPLTAETLCGVYHRLLETYFGPDVAIDGYMDWEWARIPHFYRAFLCLQIRHRVFRGCGHQPPDTGRGDVAPYLDFLHAGGSDYPAETLKRAGVDMRTPAPVGRSPAGIRGSGGGNGTTARVRSSSPWQYGGSQ